MSEIKDARLTKKEINKALNEWQRRDDDEPMSRIVADAATDHALRWVVARYLLPSANTAINEIGFRIVEALEENSDHA